MNLTQLVPKGFELILDGFHLAEAPGSCQIGEVGFLSLILDLMSLVTTSMRPSSVEVVHPKRAAAPVTSPACSIRIISELQTLQRAVTDRVLCRCTGGVQVVAADSCGQRSRPLIEYRGVGSHADVLRVFGIRS